MPTYTIRFRFLAPGLNLQDSPPRLPITLGDGRTIELQPTHPDETLGEASDLKIVIKGLPDEATAARLATRLRNAVRKSAIDLRIGFDTGKDAATSSTSNEIKDAFFSSTGSRLRDNILGVAIYDENAPSNTALVRAKGTARRSTESLVASWTKHYDADLQLTDKETLALEVFAGACREPTARSRLIALATVVEVLAERTERSTAAAALLNTFVAQLDEAGGSAGSGDTPTGALAEGDRSSLRKALIDQKRIGIASACRRYVKAHLGKKSADEFDRLYTIRSTLVHAGEHLLSDVSQEADRLHEIVVPLLAKLGLRTAPQS